MPLKTRESLEFCRTKTLFLIFSCLRRWSRGSPRPACGGPPGPRRLRGTRGSVNENVITKELASKPKHTSGHRFSPTGNTEISLGSQATGTRSCNKIKQRLLTLCPSWQELPKSTILIALLLGLQSKMFSGFKSQWIILSSGVER